MRAHGPDRPENDITLRMLDDVIDGSVTGLATYHLLRMQLEEIRRLPEFDEDPAPNCIRD